LSGNILAKIVAPVIFINTYLTVWPGQFSRTGNIACPETVLSSLIVLKLLLELSLNKQPST